MVNKKYFLLYAILGLIPLIYTLMFFSTAPDIIPISFNTDGVADRFGSKNNLIFLSTLPLLMALFTIFTPYIAKLDTHTEESYNAILNTQVAVLLVMDAIFINIIYIMVNYDAMNISNIGDRFMYIIMAMFIICGIFTPKIQRNWLVGIRTPQALISEDNWNATHKFAGQFWIIFGFTSVGLVFLTNSYEVFFVLLTIMILVPFVYSFLYFYRNK